MSSKYTAHQIYALGQFIIANQKYFPNYRIGRQIAHLEYNAQRNLADASEAYFTKYLHTTVEKAMEEAAAVQVQLTQPAKETHQQNGGVAVRIIDLSKSQQPQVEVNPNSLVLAVCAGCGVQITVTAGLLQQHGAARAFCPNCIQTATTNQESLEKAVTEFVKEVPSFYPHIENFNLLGAECERRKLTNPTLDQLIEVYAECRSKMPFKRLTEAEGRAMTSKQWEQRAKVDPGMGGLNLDAVKEGQKRGESTIHSSNKLKNWQLPEQGRR